MRQSARTENHEWAKRMVRPFIREFQQHKADIESEALVGLVKAEKHPACPAGEEFQRFAYSFVKRTVTDFTKKLRRQRRTFLQLEDEELLTGRPATPSLAEWQDSRLGYARHLHGLQRRVFMRTYGEDTYRPLAAVAADLSIPVYQAKRLHHAAVEALRDLPSVQQVA